MLSHALMSATADTARALLHSAGTNIARHGEEVLPLASRSLGDAAELLGTMTTREAQVAIGPAVNFARAGAQRVGELATLTRAGNVPSQAALDDAVGAVRTLVSALQRHA